MSNASIVIEGYIAADAKDGHTQSGDHWVSFSVPHTPRRKNRDSGEWEDAGDTLWVQVTLWRDDADRFAGYLTKGEQVRVEGEPILRAWESNGKSGVNLEVKFPKVSLIPARASQRPSEPVAASADTWAGGGFDDGSTPF